MDNGIITSCQIRLMDGFQLCRIEKRLEIRTGEMVRFQGYFFQLHVVIQIKFGTERCQYFQPLILSIQNINKIII